MTIFQLIKSKLSILLILNLILILNYNTFIKSAANNFTSFPFLEFTKNKSGKKQK